MSETHKIAKAATTIGNRDVSQPNLGFLRDMVNCQFFRGLGCSDAFLCRLSDPQSVEAIGGRRVFNHFFHPCLYRIPDQKSEEETRKVHISPLHCRSHFINSDAPRDSLLADFDQDHCTRIYSDSRKFQLTVTLNQIIFLIFFLWDFSLSAWNPELQRHFFAPALLRFFSISLSSFQSFSFITLFKIP